MCLQKCLCPIIVKKNHRSKERNSLDHVISDETSLAIQHVFDVLFVIEVLLHLCSTGIPQGLGLTGLLPVIYSDLNGMYIN